MSRDMPSTWILRFFVSAPLVLLITTAMLVGNGVLAGMGLPKDFTIERVYTFGAICGFVWAWAKRRLWVGSEAPKS